MAASAAGAILASRREPEIYESPDIEDKPDDKRPDPKNLAPEAERKTDDLVVKDLRPQLAFEQFAGKVFDTSKADFSDAVSSKLVHVISSQQAELSSLRARDRVFESPIERFNRLKEEAAQLSRDLEAFAAAQRKDSAAGTVAGLLAREMTVLDNDLSAISSNPNFQPFLAQNITDKEYLEQKALLDRLLAEMAKAAGSTDAAKPDSKATAPGQMTYELFFNPQKEAARQQVSVVELDRRIGNVEKTIGNLNDDKTLGYPDLHSALQSLRRKLEFLDQAKLDAVYRRIKTLISELDILHASKDKAQAAGQVPGQQEKISQMFDMVSRWDETAQMLPAVVARLQSLRDLHEECASAVVTVQAVDHQHSEALYLLQQDKETLSRVEANLSQNMKVLQGNVASLEARLTALTEKMQKL